MYRQIASEFSQRYFNAVQNAFDEECKKQTESINKAHNIITNEKSAIRNEVCFC